MNILESQIIYNSWLSNNDNVTAKDRLIAKSLLATDDVSVALFISEASLEDVTTVYSSLKQYKIASEPEIQDDFEANDINSEVSSESHTTRKRLDRKKAVSHVVKNLKKNNPGLEILNSRYNTLEVKLANNIVSRLKISTSRDYRNPEHDQTKICCSWHKEDDRHVNDFDYHIYITEYSQGYKALLLKTNELLPVLQKKIYNNHFVNWYFQWDIDGTVTDERERTPINVTNLDAESLNWKLN